MKAAFITTQDRIAPVYDVAGDALIVEVEGGSLKSRTREKIPGDPGMARELFFSERSVDVVICGAISRPFCEMMEARNIRVIPFISGTVEEILGAWIAGNLDKDLFCMPGCRGGGRRHGNYFGRRGGSSPDKSRGAGMGAGRGQRGKGGGRTRSGMESHNFCSCAQCGYREPHTRGTPCTEKKCPHCGSILMRE